MLYMEKKVFKSSYLFLILGLVVLLGGSYAAFEYVFSGNDSKITTDNISVQFLESDSNVIMLDNAIPMSDSEGKVQDDVFDFVVTTNTSKSTKILYSIVLSKPNVSDGYTFLSDSDIKLYLTDLNNKEIVSPVKVSSLNDYVLYSKTNSHSSSNKVIEDKYRLRMWISDDVDASSWNENTKLEYKLKINISGQEVS